jgi:hypothetical protein
VLFLGTQINEYYWHDKMCKKNFDNSKD